MQMFFLFTVNAILAAIAIHYSILLAASHGIADHPAGHKQHAKVTPFVGGVGIFAALLIALIPLIYTYPELLPKWLALGFGSAIVFFLGFTDDLLQIRLLIQAMAALIMVLAGGVVLSDLGSLLSEMTLGLGLLAIPFTVFAAIGMMNAINMIDGIDGLAGTVSLISLLLICAVASIAGDLSNLMLAIALAGGTTGFLFFNLRYAAKRNARVFLGDNGSMLLGFVFAWLLVDLSQKPNSAMTPVTAIWLISMPLMDAISVMLRRVWLRTSPFTPDHNHLHNILLHAGYGIKDTVFVIVTLHLLFGTIGLAGLYLEVSEPLMLLGSLLVFVSYFYVSARPWYLIMGLRHLLAFLGLTRAKNHGVFIGNHTATEAADLIHIVSRGLGPGVDSWMVVLDRKSARHDFKKCYAVVVNIRLVNSDCATDEQVEQYVVLLQRQMKRCGIEVRPFVERNTSKDRRIQDYGSTDVSESRISERRAQDSKLLVFEAIFDKSHPPTALLFPV
jgi:UDP-GlcNAc:undecaprenyl-phosphate GlcNAc-1-phosphate transferase